MVPLLLRGGSNLTTPATNLDNALNQLVSQSKVTIVSDGPLVRNKEHYHCKVHSVWKSSTMVSPVSWFMQKKSPFTPFVGQMINKLAESGITNILSRRHLIAEPNCKPVRRKGKSLGMEKFASLFTIYLIGCFSAIVIFVMELIFKPKAHPNSNQSTFSKVSAAQAAHNLKVEIENLHKRIVMNNCDLYTAKHRTEDILHEVKALIVKSRVGNRGPEPCKIPPQTRRFRVQVGSRWVFFGSSFFMSGTRRSIGVHGKKK